MRLTINEKDRELLSACVSAGQDHGDIEDSEAESLYAKLDAAAESIDDTDILWRGSVLIIRTPMMARFVDFFKALGLEFKAEKHGNGPLHFACEREGQVFEIYPPK